MMPKIAEGDANKVWIVPSEIGKALEGLGSTMNDLAGHPAGRRRPEDAGRHGRTERPELGGSGALADTELRKANAAVEAAIAEAARPPTRGATAPAAVDADRGAPGAAEEPPAP